MQRLKIFHETIYSYTRPIVLGAHKLLVRPRDGHDIRIEASKLDIFPAALVSWHRDELDNSVALATFADMPTKTLRITSEVTVTHYLSSRDVLPLDASAQMFPLRYTEHQQQTLNALLFAPAVSPSLDEWLNQIKVETSTIALLLKLSAAIYEGFSYQLREEEGVQSPLETLRKKTGSCRDYAWFFVVAARQLGLASRFVSGYFHTAGTALLDGSTHAWAEVFLPGAGWTGFDPTCNRITAESHIPVSVAINPEDIPPVSGLFVGPSDERPTMTVRVNVSGC
jgi:transglutaminase-like putative cysteine protease